mgnify:CR=1 FL=1
MIHAALQWPPLDALPVALVLCDACDEADTHHDVWCPEPKRARREARKSGTRETKRTALIASA